MMRRPDFVVVSTLLACMAACGPEPELDLAGSASPLDIHIPNHVQIGAVRGESIGGIFRPPVPRFPSTFQPQTVIAIHDVNGDGMLAPLLGLPDANQTYPAPVGPAGGPGARIGSSLSMTAPGSSNPPGPGFCGDILVVAHQTIGTEQYWLWFGLRSPGYQPPAHRPCHQYDVDVGAVHVMNGAVVSHTTLIGSQAGGSAISQFNYEVEFGDATIQRPGRVEIGNIARMVLPEISGIFTRRLVFDNVSMVAPLIGDDAWDGERGFPSVQGPDLEPNEVLALPVSGALDQNSVAYADLDGDGLTDVCYKDGFDVVCAHLRADRTSTPPRTWAVLDSSSSATEQPFYLADIDGNGKPDICAAGPNGLQCAMSDGQRTTSVRTIHPGIYTDRFRKLVFLDFDADGRVDLCATRMYTVTNVGGRLRFVKGVSCFRNDGATVSTQVNDSPLFWSGAAGSAYEETLMAADFDGDRIDEVCMRESMGLVCVDGMASSRKHYYQLENHMTDANGWNQPQYYRTIQAADINGDRKADFCGRGSGGIQCALSTYSRGIFQTHIVVPNYSNSNGWNQPRFYETIHLTDDNGDGRIDVCGRGNAGILCAYNQGTYNFVPSFSSNDLRLQAFLPPRLVVPGGERSKTIAPIQADQDAAMEWAGFVGYTNGAFVVTND